MKDNYSPYPSLSNSERLGTLEYDDYEMYVYKFYHNKDFHVKRIERGKSQEKYDKKMIAIYSAITGVLGVGALVFGVDAFANPEFLGSGLVASTIASFVSAASAAGVAKSGIIQNIRNLSHARQDIDASKQMIEEITKEEEKKKEEAERARSVK